jgi:quercetin dioxygenase-like cupin family protein
MNGFTDALLRETRNDDDSTFANHYSRRQFLLASAAFAAALSTGRGAVPGANAIPTTQLVSPGAYGVLSVLGPTVEFYTSPAQDDAVYSVFRGTLPPGISVPLHSHPDDESFLLLSGTVQGITARGTGFEWFDVPTGGFVHVPKNAKHAWRNVSLEPVVQLVITTARLGRFFQDVGKPITPTTPPGPPTPQDIQRFMEVAAAYGHWLGSPAENAAIGIRV